MKQLKSAGQKLFQIYFTIGVVAMGLLAALVFFAVVMRYFFTKSWKELSEFNVTLFAFTTFWGLGVNVLKNEHVTITMLYDKFPAPVKKVLSIVNYLIVLVVDFFFTWQGWIYAAKMGKQISQGMEIPMVFMYGIMPLSGILCAVCIIIKLVEFIQSPPAAFDQKDEGMGTLAQ